MEQYLKGKMRAVGHRCKECRFYRDHHCGNKDYHGSRNYEKVYGDPQYTRPDDVACFLYDGEEEYDE